MGINPTTFRIREVLVVFKIFVLYCSGVGTWPVVKTWWTPSPYLLLGMTDIQTRHKWSTGTLKITGGITGKINEPKCQVVEQWNSLRILDRVKKTIEKRISNYVHVRKMKRKKDTDFPTLLPLLLSMFENTSINKIYSFLLVRGLFSYRVFNTSFVLRDDVNQL